jgi:glyoxylase-like metal-dependent hydrolase (beta-lactamase superfamily II)
VLVTRLDAWVGGKMIEKLVNTIGLMLLISGTAGAQDAKTVLDNATKAMGAGDLKTIEYSGSGGTNSDLGLLENWRPEDPWPSFNTKSYVHAINYGGPTINERDAHGLCDCVSPSAREEMVSTQRNPVHGGGYQPILTERHQVQLVNGNFAWDLNAITNAPVVQPLTDDSRLLHIWMTPQGFLIAATNYASTVEQQTINGKRYNVVTFAVTVAHSNNPKIVGYINEQNLLERLESWVDNPVLGDMPIDIEYSDYKQFGEVKFPTKILEKQGDYPMRELVIGDVKTNMPVDVPIPSGIRGSLPVASVDSQKVASGVYWIGGVKYVINNEFLGSAVVEFKDFIVVFEAPEDEERTLLVMAELKRLIPNKPIKYIINSHTHLDHSGGVRTYVAEGATIITQDGNKAFWEQAVKAPHTLNPDELSAIKTPTRTMVEGVAEDRVITDGVRTLEIYRLQGNLNADYLLMAYLPKEKIVIESDAFGAPAPGTPPKIPPNPDSVNFYDNLVRLKLDVTTILSVHGRSPIPISDLLRALGKTSM